MGVHNIGGSWWACRDCGRAIKAACECCAPPECGCRPARGAPIPCIDCGDIVPLDSDGYCQPCNDEARREADANWPGGDCVGDDDDGPEWDGPPDTWQSEAEFD